MIVQLYRGPCDGALVEIDELAARLIVPARTNGTLAHFAYAFDVLTGQYEYSCKLTSAYRNDAHADRAVS